VKSDFGTRHRQSPKLNTPKLIIICDVTIIVERRKWSPATYVVLALAVGAISATFQGLKGAAWLGAWNAGPVFGLILGGLVKVSRRDASIPRWMFWTTVATFVIYVVGAAFAWTVEHPA
jgi:hypothetical protein